MLSRMSLIACALVLAVVPVCPAEEPAPLRQVRIQAECVHVPVGFCERAGLPHAKHGEDRSCYVGRLTAREAKMLAALLRVEPGMDLLSHPQIITQDGQAAAVAVGQTVPVVTGLEPLPGQPGLFRLKTTYEDVGVNLTMTPKLSADGKYVRLTMRGTYRVQSNDRVSAKVARPSGKAVGEAILLPIEAGYLVDEEVAEGEVRLPVGGTAVMACHAVGTHECLWVSKVEVVEAERSSAVFPLQQVTAVDVAETLNAVLGTEGQCSTVVVAEPITNKLLVSGSAAALERIAKMVKALDVPAK